ncbi:hypothetical protein [Deinococcus aquaticus]|uniref:hypothetical protein n=1 Tax=Deinococcus aquaticus TaxID=328692 RepID=UPI003616C588
MTALNLGRTAAISLLGQLTEAQTLYSVPNPARRYLRYYVDEDEIRSHPAAPPAGERHPGEPRRAARAGALFGPRVYHFA